MSYEIRPASRQNNKPMICLYSESGAGKTFSALLLARGFSPTGKVRMIETENRRGEAYSDDPRIPGGYDVIPMDAPFSPQNYHAAIVAAEQAQTDVLVIDSGSHEWEGVGGVLDMAATKMANGAKSMLAWQQPKIDHQKFFINKLLQTSIPLVILCLRAKHVMIEVPNPKKPGEKMWVRDNKLSPKQSDDILFESNCHAWIDHDHRLHITRADQRGLSEVLADNQPVTLETGKRLAEWAAGHASAPSPFRIVRLNGTAAQAKDADDWGAKMQTAIDSLPDPEKLKRFRVLNGAIIAELAAAGHEQATAVDTAFSKALAAL